MAFPTRLTKVGYSSEHFNERTGMCYHQTPPWERVVAYVGDARQAKPHLEHNPLSLLGVRHAIPMRKLNDPEQDVSWQRDALHQVGCREEHVLLDIASGARTARPGLAACLQALAPGDTLVVWRLDRLGRSMTHLVTLIDELLRRQIRFRSLCDGALDT